MLSSAETDLVRRDQSIPGLATVLDDETFVARMRRCAPGSSLRTARILFIKYKPGRSCRVSYRLEVAGEEVDVCVRAYGVEDRDRFLDERELPAVTGRLGWGCVALEDCAVLVSVFPNDHKLPALLRLMDDKDRRKLLGELLPDHAELGSYSLQCLRYKPERRYLARLQAAHGTQAAVKWYTEKGYTRGKRHAEAFQSRGPLRVARPIGWSDHNRAVAFEWLAGSPLMELCAARGIDCRPLTVAGAALAEVHEQKPAGLVCRSRADEVADLMSLSDALGSLCPYLAVRAECVARRIAAQLSGAPAMHDSVHGDFSAKQTLVGPHEVGILDFDTAYYGDSADDLGNFIAQIERYALRGEISSSQAERLRDALLEGYGLATRRPLPQRIGLYTAIGLLRRTQYPFQVREPDWPQRTESLLERAEVILNTGRC